MQRDSAILDFCQFTAAVKVRAVQIFEFFGQNDLGQFGAVFEAVLRDRLYGFGQCICSFELGGNLVQYGFVFVVPVSYTHLTLPTNREV